MNKQLYMRKLTMHTFLSIKLFMPRAIMIVTCALTASQSTNFALAAPIKSTSLEVFRDTEPPMWEVSVHCEGESKPRVMTKALDSEQWCSNDITGLCDENKFSLSQQLCDNSVNQSVSDFSKGNTAADNDLKVESDTLRKHNDLIGTAEYKEAAKSVNINNGNIQTSAAPANTAIYRNNLLKEQIQIEEQRILIQQKRLELRNLELSLRKRQLSSN